MDSYSDSNYLLKELNLSDKRMKQLVLSLTPEQLDVPYVVGINPPIWEMGHAAFFYETFLLRKLYDLSPLMPGHDEMWDSFEIPHKERWKKGVVPNLTDTCKYYDKILTLCRERLSSSKTLTPQESYLFQYSIAHHNMHIESLLWLRQTLAYPAPEFLGYWNSETPKTQQTDLTVPAGEYFIGKKPPLTDTEKAEDFCFDNEKPGFHLKLPSFSISNTLVSNQDFLNFVESGGYENLGHWSYGGKHWLKESKAKMPKYWKYKDGTWQQRRFDQWEHLRLDAPVLHINFREAEAYCHWAKRRLPNEFEWEVAAKLYAETDPDYCDLGGKFAGTSPTKALSINTNKCIQMLGTCWEWTTNQYLPFDGFHHDMYAYMSTLQFGDHKTTRGGSWATAESLIRPTYRQAYLPERRDIFVGFRTCAIN